MRNGNFSKNNQINTCNTEYGSPICVRKWTIKNQTDNQTSLRKKKKKTAAVLGVLVAFWFLGSRSERRMRIGFEEWQQHQHQIGQGHHCVLPY